MLSITVDAKDALASIRRQRRNIQIAAAVAVTRTVNLARTEVETEMRRVFDRPTPYTLRSPRTTAATLANGLVATLRIHGRDDLGGNVDWSPAELLGHQFAGGTRHAKRLEGWLKAAGLIVAGEFIAPGAAAPLDAYGNLSRGTVVRVMSQLKLGLDPAAWASKSKRSKAGIRKRGRIFWSRGTRELPRGAWIDYGPPVGVRPLLIVVKRPQYRRRINLQQIVHGAIRKHLDAQFHRALAERAGR